MRPMPSPSFKKFLPHALVSNPPCSPDSPICRKTGKAFLACKNLLIQKIPKLLIIQISFQIPGIILRLHSIL